MSIILTTVIRNSETFPILLKYANVLHSMNCLDSLRIIDRCLNDNDSIKLKKKLFSDNVDITSSLIKELKEVDPRCYHAESLQNYHHEKSGKTLVKGGPACRIFYQGVGVCLGLGSHRGAKEIVLSAKDCFIRDGKGGGNIVTRAEVSDISLTAWNYAELSWVVDGTIRVITEVGEKMEILVDDGYEAYDLTVSSLANGKVSVALTDHLVDNILEKQSSFYEYISYSRLIPKKVDGCEVLSKNDIVFIDINSWKDNILKSGVPLVIGENTCFDVLKSMKMFKCSDKQIEMHRSFLTRTKRVLSKCKSDYTSSLKIDKKSKVVEINHSDVGASESGPPIIFSILSKNLLTDHRLIEDYSNVDLSNIIHCHDDHDESCVIIHLESILQDPKKTEELFYEIAETLTEQQRKKMLNMLSKFS